MNILTEQELERLGRLLYKAYCDGDGYREVIAAGTGERIMSLSAERAWVLMGGFMMERESTLRQDNIPMQDHVETFWAMIDELN